MNALLALALIACGDPVRPPRPPEWSATEPVIRDDHALLAPDPTVSRVVVLMRAPIGANDGAIALALARSLDGIEVADGWSTVDVAPAHTDLMVEVPSDQLRVAIDAIAARLHALAPMALPPDDSRERMIATARGRRALSEADARARYDRVQVLVVGNFDRAAATTLVAGALGDRAVAELRTHPNPGVPHVTLHDHQRDRATLVFDVADAPATRVAARLLLAALPGVDARIDPPFTVELSHAAPDVVLAAIARLAEDPGDLAAPVAAAELEHLTALEGLAYRARMLADRHARWDHPPTADVVEIVFRKLLRDPLIVLGDAE